MIHIANFAVHSLASLSYSALLFLRVVAISGSNGLSRFGSVSMLYSDNRTALMFRFGAQESFKMSRQISPFELMFGW